MAKSGRKSSASASPGEAEFERMVIAFGVAQAVREVRFSGNSVQDKSFQEEVKALREAARLAWKALAK
jgi:hypothetical protein